MNTESTTIATPAKKHRKISAETKAKMSAAKKGKVLSAETKAKMSAAKKGKVLSAETKAKMSAAKKGHVVSDATKAKMARSHRKTFISKTGFGREQATALRNEYASRKTKLNADGEKVTYQSLAEKYHISIAYVYAVLKNKVWKVRERSVVPTDVCDTVTVVATPVEAVQLLNVGELNAEACLSLAEKLDEALSR